MDPIAQAEEEKRFKEEAELRELNETLMLDDTYFSSRDLAFKGKDVLPMGKHRKQIQQIATTLRFNVQVRRRGSMSLDLGSSNNTEADDELQEIDLNAKPRVFVCSGPVNKKEPDGILRKVSRRHLFVFTDVILLTTKKEGMDMFDVVQVLWVKDLRLRYTLCADTEEDRLTFEFIVYKPKQRTRFSVSLFCDNETSWKQWIEDLENTLLAYHRQTELSKQLGWFHEIIQGNFFSAAYLGDTALLRKYLKFINEKSFKSKIASSNNPDDSYQLPTSIDALDKSGMSALHWACLKGHEIIVRVLLDRGADTDVFQKGMNTPLLLAAAFGHETIARLLIENGADINTRNTKGHDAVFMAVLYGHATKGLPWLLQLFTARGMNLNDIDSEGATPLHLCAARNLARPVRMLVDSGADVNARHGETQLTPLQMACTHIFPDVETIRSFLDKGAYPNWKDSQGRTAFELTMRNHPNNRNNLNSQNQFLATPPVVFGQSGTDVNINDVLVGNNGKLSDHDPNSMHESDSYSVRTVQTNDSKWRAMEETISVVGDWAVRALPALLELSKKGARIEMKDIDSLRPSFKAAVIEAKEVWEKKAEPNNFLEFVQVREQSGEDLRLHKAVWSKNKTSNICQLCSDQFSLTNRRHHCRACGVLTCDKCSSKRLHLTSTFSSTGPDQVQLPNENTRSSFRDSFRESTFSVKSDRRNKDDGLERVCDGCFNRLCHEASQPSPDHFRVRQLKSCALDLIHTIEELIDSLDDPDGDPSSFQSSLRDTMALTKDLDTININGNRSSTPKNGISSGKSNGTPRSPAASSPATPYKTAELLIDVLRLRENRLYRTEDFMAKFLEAADGYHRISKRLIEQKLENSRLWGSNSNGI